MGGKAFAALSPPLFTPRMPFKIYENVLAATHSILRRHFKQVDSPSKLS
jgi:hypothetical protein